MFDADPYIYEIFPLDFYNPWIRKEFFSSSERAGCHIWFDSNVLDNVKC